MQSLTFLSFSLNLSENCPLLGTVAPLELGHTGSDVFRGLCQNVALGEGGQVSHGVAGYGHKQILQKAFDKLITGHSNPLPRPCLQVLDPRANCWLDITTGCPSNWRHRPPSEIDLPSRCIALTRDSSYAVISHI